MNGLTENNSSNFEVQQGNEFHSKRRVLVTGGTGFLGAYIIQNLVEKGSAVSALRRSNDPPFFLPPSITE
jgi:FlaA1/EpsC-like NDP-sugar epimerase